MRTWLQVCCYPRRAPAFSTENKKGLIRNQKRWRWWWGEVPYWYREIYELLMVRRASEDTLSVGDRSQSSRALDRQHAQAFKSLNHHKSRLSMMGRVGKGEED
jgi:hypothetical protein